MSATLPRLGILEYQGRDLAPRFEVFLDPEQAADRRREVNLSTAWISPGSVSPAPYQTLDARTVDEIVIDAVGPWIGLAAMVGTLLVAWLSGPGSLS